MSSQHNLLHPDEYSAIAEGAGWIDKRSRGRLRVEGRDRVAFLQALVSNDLQSLREGQGVYATYLTPQGRLLADLRIYHRGEYLLADVAPGSAAALVRRLDQLVFAEDVRVSDVSEDLAQIAVVGARAAQMLAGVLSVPVDLLQALPVWAQAVSGDAVIARTDDVELASFDVFVPATAYDGIVARLVNQGAKAVPQALAEALRIEAGRPAFGLDMTEGTIPLEAGLLERAISTTKGCYVGQEVIIRVLHRGGGRVARRLVKLEFETSVAEPPEAGTPLVADGRETGRVTSAAWSPRYGRVVALGYVHRDVAKVGGHVAARTGSVERLASIVGLAG